MSGESDAPLSILDADGVITAKSGSDLLYAEQSKERRNIPLRECLVPGSWCIEKC